MAGRTRTLVAATPLLVNLAAAAILRVVVPYTVADGGERFRYYTMSSLFPFTNCPTFHCFRVLPPLLAGLLPVSRADAFIVTGFVFQVLAGTMLWYIAERLHGSRRIAAFTTAWFWVTWGPIQSFNDPLLIADPVQMFWSLSALYLLLGRHDLLALPVLVSGAAVKESVLLIPMVYAIYAVLAKDDARHRPVWLAALIAAPLAAWLLLRIVLSTRFGYVAHEDEAYVRATYFFGIWLPNLGPWPRNLLIAALYIFGACGAAWILGPLGVLISNRRQQALTLASLPPMVFMALFQVPDRGLATFPYATLIPAACYVSRLPLPLTVAVLTINAAFSIRMNAGVAWLPRMPVILAAMVCVTAAAVWIERRRARLGGPSDVEPHPAVSVRLPRARGTADWVAWTATSLVCGLLIIVVMMQFSRRAAASASRTTRWEPESLGGTRVVDDDRGIPGIAVSSDGQWVVFVGASESTGEGAAIRALWRRRVDDTRAERIAGTEGASAPFWSPDGRAIGFFVDGKLKTIDLAAGATRVLADAPFPHGGAWSARGVIVFAPDAVGGLVQVPQAGGAVSDATGFDAARGGQWHRWPSFLPDGDRFLFAVRSSDRIDSGLYLGRLSSRGTDRITGLRSRAVYANGYLVTSLADGVYVQPFEEGRNAVFGDPRRVGRVAYAPERAAGAFDASADTLVWAAPPEPSEQPVSVELRRLDRTGRTLARLGPPADLTSQDIPRGLARRLPPRAVATSVSPDGRVLLYHAPAAPSWDVWAIATSDEGPPVRLFAPDGFTHVEAQFSPDSKWIAYVARAAGDEAVYVQPYPPSDRKWRVSVDGGAQPRWRGDGREIVYVSGDRFFRAAPIDTKHAFVVGPPRPLFEVRLRPENPGAFRFEYAMTPDAEQFLVNAAGGGERLSSLTVVTNWKASLFR